MRISCLPYIFDHRPRNPFNTKKGGGVGSPSVNSPGLSRAASCDNIINPTTDSSNPDANKADFPFHHGLTPAPTPPPAPPLPRRPPLPPPPQERERGNTPPDGLAEPPFPRDDGGMVVVVVLGGTPGTDWDTRCCRCCCCCYWCTETEKSAGSCCPVAVFAFACQPACALVVLLAPLGLSVPSPFALLFLIVPSFPCPSL